MQCILCTLPQLERDQAVCWKMRYSYSRDMDLGHFCPVVGEVARIYEMPSASCEQSMKLCIQGYFSILKSMEISAQRENVYFTVLLCINAFEY